MEQAYLDLLTHILQHGQDRPDRTGTGVRGVFGYQLRFDISQHIPLLTTKFVSFKHVLRELLWFLRGDTNSKHLEENGVNIWQGNTSRDFLDARGLTHYQEGDIGPMYGFNWRHFGSQYKGCDKDYQGLGVDQLKQLIDGLKTEPFSRRHVITTFDPSVRQQGVLEPCHGLVVQFYVDNDRGLSCHMYQRSCDTFLGLPYNIASYSIMTYIIAKKVGLKPRDLIISLGDTHIYFNHLNQVRRQATRTPYPPPVLRVSNEIVDKSFDELSETDFELMGYQHHSKIKAAMAI